MRKNATIRKTVSQNLVLHGTHEFRLWEKFSFLLVIFRSDARGHFFG